MPKKIFRYLALIILLIVLGFGFGYLKTFISLSKPHNTPQGNNEHDVSSIQEIKLNSGAKLIFITHYTGCGHEVRQEKPLENKFIGFTKDQLEKQMKDWKIESFTPNEVILRKQVEGLCDEHYYIGLNDGYVTLFQGLPGMPSKVIEKTDILADTLKKEDHILLEKGIIINSRDEFLKIREGLTN